MESQHPTIVESCPARAALAGNPSDGYGGTVVSVPLHARSATVRLASTDETHVEFRSDATHHGQAPPGDVIAPEDVMNRDMHGDMHDAMHDDMHDDMHGVVELVTATLRRHGRHVDRPAAPCTVDVTTTISRSVGLAGSSAIVIALLRALQRHAGLPPFGPDELASLALSVEVDELGFAAGLQDRVVQAYGRPMSMRFGPDDVRVVNGLQAGTYDELLHPIPGWLTVAARSTESEPSQQVHRSLRERHRVGDPLVVVAMSALAASATRAAEAIATADAEMLGRAMDETYDIRSSIMDIRPGQSEMIRVARHAGAFANFAGSGGAVSVLALDETTSLQASARLEAIGCEIIDVGTPARPHT